jgi:hypothetical protein
LRTGGFEEKVSGAPNLKRFDAPIGDPLVESGLYLRQRAAMSTE